MNIALIGFRGTGKTTIGKQLAGKLGMRFADADDEIAKKAGMSIPEIFGKELEAGFRARERAAIEKLSECDNCVIATGGGSVLNPENIRNLRKNAKIVLLEASAEEIYESIKGDSNRPKLTDQKNEHDEIVHLLSCRMPFYRSAADFIIKTRTGKTTQTIISWLNSKAKIAVPIAAESMASALEDIEKANDLADLVELRLDLIGAKDEEAINKLISACKKPVIATQQEVETAIAASKAGAAYIDLPYGSGGNEIARISACKGNSRLILSHHNPYETPNADGLIALYEEIAAEGAADAVKIVCFAKEEADNNKIIGLLDYAMGKKPLIAFCMGALGKRSRIECAGHGSLFTFASLAMGKESAEGQIEVKEMRELLGGEND